MKEFAMAKWGLEKVKQQLRGMTAKKTSSSFLKGYGKACLYAGILALATAPITLNNRVDSTLTSQDKYTLAQEIAVVDTTFPVSSEAGTPEKRLKVEDIDFSEPFRIETDRYTLINKKDHLPSRLLGHFFTVPLKILFMDPQIGWGVDADKARTSLAILENNPDIKDVTVRLNHSAPITDTGRLFTDDSVVDRNPFVARATMGLLSTLIGNFTSEISRADHYSPLTQTVSVYSNVESILAHEIGHHKDFQRFDSDWWYSIGRNGLFPPATMLFTEYQASYNAYDLLAPDDQRQVWRYLTPAFLTYLVAGYKINKKYLQKLVLHRNGKRSTLERFSELEENERPKIPPHHVIREYATDIASLGAGIASYMTAAEAGLPPIAAGAAFVAGGFGTRYALHRGLDWIMPYTPTIRAPRSTGERIKHVLRQLDL